MRTKNLPPPWLWDGGGEFQIKTPLPEIFSLISFLIISLLRDAEETADGRAVELPATAQLGYSAPKYAIGIIGL